MDTPGDRLYSSEHEWILMDGDEGTVGITAFAQDQLGDIVYVEVPDVGTAVRKGEAFGVVESVKAVSDLFAPVGGEVVARNEDLEDTPELLNQSPYERGWLLRIKLSDRGELDSLLDAGAYQREVGES
ncbi:MAG: glycine cleavage system protein GcvH [Dehalococcoidia bacterium]